MHKLPRTEPTSRIGDTATLDRAASERSVSGVGLLLRADTATFGHDAVHLVLSITNNTGRPVGYRANDKPHFALMNDAKQTLWNDAQCTAADPATSAPGFVELKAGEHVSIEDDYSPSCGAQPGHAWLTGAATVCLNLAADAACRGASDARVQATPIAVTVL